MKGNTGTGRAWVYMSDDWPSRLERQLTMTLPQMLADLPRACDVGTRRNEKGHTTSWIGYKLHVDTADGGIPIRCIMMSASTHDS